MRLPSELKEDESFTIHRDGSPQLTFYREYGRLHAAITCTKCVDIGCSKSAQQDLVWQYGDDQGNPEWEADKLAQHVMEDGECKIKKGVRQDGTYLLG